MIKIIDNRRIDRPCSLITRKLIGDVSHIIFFLIIMNYYCDVCSIKFKNRSILICHLASNHRGPFPLVDVTKYIDEHGHKSNIIIL